FDTLADRRPLGQPREDHVNGRPPRHHQIERPVHPSPQAARSTITVTSASAVRRNDAGTSGPTGPSSARCTMARLIAPDTTITIWRAPSSWRRPIVTALAGTSAMLPQYRALSSRVTADSPTPRVSDLEAEGRSSTPAAPLPPH